MEVYILKMLQMDNQNKTYSDYFSPEYIEAFNDLNKRYRELLIANEGKSKVIGHSYRMESAILLQNEVVSHGNQLAKMLLDVVLS